MKTGDLVYVNKEQEFSIRTGWCCSGQTGPGLVVEKYDVEPYWKIQLLGTTDCVLVEPCNVEVLNESV